MNFAEPRTQVSGNRGPLQPLPSRSRLGQDRVCVPRTEQMSRRRNCLDILDNRFGVGYQDPVFEVGGTREETDDFQDIQQRVDLLAEIFSFILLLLVPAGSSRRPASGLGPAALRPKSTQGVAASINWGQSK